MMVNVIIMELKVGANKPAVKTESRHRANCKYNLIEVDVTDGADTCNTVKLSRKHHRSVMGSRIRRSGTVEDCW